MMFIRTLVKFRRKYEKIFLSLHHVAPKLWAPNNVGAGVTQWREEYGQLCATEAVYHGCDLLGILDPGVLLLSHLEQAAQKAKSPLFILRHLLHRKCFSDPELRN